MAAERCLQPEMRGRLELETLVAAAGAQFPKRKNTKRRTEHDFKQMIKEAERAIDLVTISTHPDVGEAFDIYCERKGKGKGKRKGQYFGKSSGLGFGRRVNPRDHTTGEIMKCSICSSENHLRAHCDQAKGGGKGSLFAGPPNFGYISIADTVAEDLGPLGGIIAGVEDHRDRVTAYVVNPPGQDPWTESDPWQPGRSSTGAFS